MEHLHVAVAGTMWAFPLAGGVVSPRLGPGGPFAKQAEPQAGHAWLGFDGANIALWLPNCIMVNG
jgi:hypothetical protein